MDQYNQAKATARELPVNNVVDDLSRMEQWAARQEAEAHRLEAEGQQNPKQPLFRVFSGDLAAGATAQLNIDSKPGFWVVRVICAQSAAAGKVTISQPGVDDITVFATTVPQRFVFPGYGRSLQLTSPATTGAAATYQVAAVREWTFDVL